MVFLKKYTEEELIKIKGAGQKEKKYMENT